MVIVRASLIFWSVGPRFWADAADSPNANTGHANTRLKFTRLLASFVMMYSPSFKVRLRTTRPTSMSSDGCDGRIDGIAETLDDHIHLLPVHDERRSEQNMVSPDAVDRAAHRVDEQAARHRFALDQRVQLQWRSKGLLGITVGD